MATSKEILIYANWKEFNTPVLMGVLNVISSRGKEIFSFEYDKEWLNAGHSQYLDPDLQMYAGRQYLNEEKNNFGIFLDSSPDRWGRLLMRRREAVLARVEERKPKTLLESDYLLGVYDENRMGAIRFKTNAAGPFLHDDPNMATPPWTSLRELEHASLELEKEDIADDPEYLKWLNLLLAPGSSLGGARPKASVRDSKGILWIAKFPSRNDDKNIGAWEMVVHELAIKAGLNMAEAMALNFSGKHHCFITKRFDRTNSNERIHFASAMTLLGYTDGTDAQDGVSYLDIAGFIMQHGAKPEQDLEELWRRIVFNICVKNTDDHLRNHGFLLTEKGWTLSPAYDINPVETGTGLTLNISENDNSLDLALAMEVSEYFHVQKKNAHAIIDKILIAISDWKKIAQKSGITRDEQSRMARAFEIDHDSYKK